ncbi:mediator of RNA polymerase II transcription subunit 27 [Daktulosphaira vitifoliae]|uniref:mediator of RNA polymerase II transcription subunit 27 n=1 Tax=Daktulosphaira vitifoliae TaxID=58002 RepID=UPI0021A9D7A9|nr:mediator of RNA polymerase II transcription subunit 27 [Daktulosphaira vitifoliae]
MDLNNMQVALNTVRTLRLELMQLIIEIGEGVKEDGTQCEPKDNRYICTMNEMVGKLGNHMRHLEQVVGSLSSPPAPIASILYNTSYLTQESTSDRQALYTPLVSSHKWLDKVHKFSSNALQILSQNSLKKSYHNSSSNKKKRHQSTLLNISPQAFDGLLTNIDRMFPDLNITITRPCSSNVVLLVGLGRVLQAIVTFKGIMIEWVIVKGFNEPINPNNLQQELWSESRYQVFRKITDHANAAMLHFSSSTLPEFSVKSFMMWLNSYTNLFNSVCKACSNRLLNAYPPTWRDLRSLETYHFECKP